MTTDIAVRPLAELQSDPALVDSLEALRETARQAQTRDEVRHATPEEVALAETQRLPWHCTGHSSRTGLPCRKPRVKVTTVCATHGASLKTVKEAARRRFLSEIDPTITRLMDIRDQDEHLPSALGAAKTILARAVGPEAEVGKAGQKAPTINIGFAVGLPGGAPADASVSVTTIEATEEE
jgi:hypothetical protein